MAWRVVEHGRPSLERDGRRGAPTPTRRNGIWSSRFGASSTERQSFWATYPLSSSSKAALFAQAEKLSNEALTAFLSEHLD